MPACRLCPLPAAGLLLRLLLFIFLSAAGTGAEKPGGCPQLQASTDCVKQCASDDDCEDDAKCCPAGCSSVCSTPNGLSKGKVWGTAPTAKPDPVRITLSAGDRFSTKPPVTRKEDNQEKKGTCPRVDIPKLGICEDQCQLDVDCSGNMKCCRNGCGKMTCTTPDF